MHMNWVKSVRTLGNMEPKCWIHGSQHRKDGVESSTTDIMDVLYLTGFLSHGQAQNYERAFGNR